MLEPFSKASTYYTLLFVLQALISGAVIVVPAIFEYILSAYMDMTGRQLFRATLWASYIVAFQQMLTYTASVSIWRRLWTRAYSPNLKSFVRWWLAFCFLLHLGSAMAVWRLYVSADHIVSAEEHALWRGIDLYYSCPEWKLLWDGMQYHKECCGVTGYADWMKASWMPNTTTVECGDLDSSVSYKTNTLAPYACCKHDCASCYQSYTPKRSAYGNAAVPSLRLSEINQGGCLISFAGDLNAMLHTLIALSAAGLVVFFVIWSIGGRILECQPELTADEASLMSRKYRDEDGRFVVLVKCPPNVRCIVDDDREVASRSHFPPREDLRECYLVSQEVVNPPKKGRLQDSETSCGCSLNARPTRILH